MTWQQETAEQRNAGVPRPRDTGALFLAASGIAAAFGAASCCALPMLLGSLGLGSAWLATVAWFAAPHRVALLAVATASLVCGGVLFLWRHGVAACAADHACHTSMKSVLVTGLLTVGAMLVVLGYFYA
ncbi:MAG TPA: mercuric reductase [Stellaceae bacterium]|jgi:mercuric ion transport protein|nr:mercuric reductase [Stellaceae bacterium]